MSVAHVRMSKIRDDGIEVVYLAETPDPSPGEKWESLGILRIKKGEGYIFEMSPLAEKHQALPPELFSRSEDEQTRMLIGEYSGYGWGAWSMRIHHWANRFICENFFPESFPDIYPSRGPSDPPLG